MKHEDDDWIVLIDDSETDMHEDESCEDSSHCSCNTTINSSDEDVAQAILNTSFNSNTPLLTRAYISKNKENTSETEETNKKVVIKSSIVNTNQPSRFYHFTIHTRKYQMIIVGLIIVQVILYCWTCKNSDI